MHRGVLTLAAMVLLGTGSAQAALVVGTEPEGNGGFGVGFSFSDDINLIIGQAFTLSSAVTVDSITLYLNGDGSDEPQSDFTLQVMDLIGSGATAANVLLTQTGTFPSGPLPTGHAPVTFSGLGLSLGVGTYYLVVGSEQGTGSGWGFNAPTLPGGVGTIGPAFVGLATGGAVADFTNLDPSSPNTDVSHVNFRIDSARAPSGVPEPATSSLLLCGFGLLVGSRVVRRKRA